MTMGGADGVGASGALLITGKMSEETAVMYVCEAFSGYSVQSEAVLSNDGMPLPLERLLAALTKRQSWW